MNPQRDQQVERHDSEDETHDRQLPDALEGRRGQAPAARADARRGHHQEHEDRQEQQGRPAAQRIPGQARRPPGVGRDVVEDAEDVAPTRGERCSAERAQAERVDEQVAQVDGDDEDRGGGVVEHGAHDGAQHGDGTEDHADRPGEPSELAYHLLDGPGGARQQGAPGARGRQRAEDEDPDDEEDPHR